MELRQMDSGGDSINHFGNGSQCLNSKFEQNSGDLSQGEFMTIDEKCSTTESGSQQTYWLSVDWADLLDRIQNRDPDAPGELYSRISTPIFFFLRRRMSVEQAEDRTHDVFLILIDAIRGGRIQNPAAFPGYAVMVARRQAFAQFRRSSRFPEANEEALHTLSADTRHDPYSILEESECNVLIQKAFASLNSRQREVLDRFYVLEESKEKICGEMKLTQTQYRLLKSRAKARFGEVGRKVLRPTVGLLRAG
jgi:RNA polymerase sigma factor (sigma-70 family)